MTVMGGNRYCPGKETYTSREQPNDHDGGRPVLARKRRPMRHEYCPMTVIRLLADHDGGKPVLPGKRDPTHDEYSPMTVIGGKPVLPGNE